VDGQDAWFVNHRGLASGPMPWRDVTYYYRAGAYDGATQVCQVGTQKWATIQEMSKVLPVDRDPESAALLPSKHEMPLYLGFILWVVGFIALIGARWLGIIIMWAAIGVQIYGVANVRKKTMRTTTGTVGDIFAGLMIFALAGATALFTWLVLTSWG